MNEADVVALIEAVEEASEHHVQLPVQRSIGAGYAVQADMMIGLTPEHWDAIVAATNNLVYCTDSVVAR